MRNLCFECTYITNSGKEGKSACMMINIFLKKSEEYELRLTFSIFRCLSHHVFYMKERMN